MQIKKDRVREQITATAKSVFLRKGFAKTSVRNIADGAGVSVSNLYNYFDGKDELFVCIVSPLIARMERLVGEHHSVKYHAQFLKYATGESDEMIPQNIEIYLQLITDYRDELKLLLFKSQGSSLEHFIDEYTDTCTRQVVEFMDGFKQKYPQFSMVLTPFTYHIHTVWMFSFISEVVNHQLTSKEMEAAIADYIHFEYTGWRELMSRPQAAE